MIKKPIHPGVHIRKHVIPSDMSVTRAAKLLNIGRPALSRLLNEQSSLSPSMAIRIEKTFGVDHNELLNMQAKFDSSCVIEKRKSLVARSYAPDFITIKAREIEVWSDSADARDLLPVLLRKLVHSTNQKTTRVDFPGYDNAEQKGFDGLIETVEANAWVPEGKSCWELSTASDPKSKAERDYQARHKVKSKASYSFVFVSSRSWPSKNKWAKEKDKEGAWKEVRAYDASDLEQWLETSIPAQLWFSEQLNKPYSKDVETLESFWRTWAQASDPEISEAIFDTSIAEHRDKFLKWISEPGIKPLTVAAASKTEALAFLACLFKNLGEEKNTERNCGIIFKSAEKLKLLAQSKEPLFIVVFTADTEESLATVYRNHHCIIARTHNQWISKPDISLGLLSHKHFEKTLRKMDFSNCDQINRLARLSGRSPTILRRRLSKIDAIKEPIWAKKDDIVRNLIPMAMIGAWHKSTKADREAVESIAVLSPYTEIEEKIPSLCKLDDSPIWIFEEYCGVTSQLDTLFAVGQHITETYLDKFFELATCVLPMKRGCSNALRNGICNTLVIFSALGESFLPDTLPVKKRVSGLIKKLLEPLTVDKLLTYDSIMPFFAEADPELFLDLIGEYYKTHQSVEYISNENNNKELFSRDPSNGLLDSLECLAWKNLSSVNKLLARLAESPIVRGWSRSPVTSLKAINRSRIPATAAPLEKRTRALAELIRDFPEIGWQICIDEFNDEFRLVPSNCQPLWRSDSLDIKPPTPEDINIFRRNAVKLVLEQEELDQKKLGDLVMCIRVFTKAENEIVWKKINDWAKSNKDKDEKNKARLREQIRKFALTKQSQRRHELTVSTIKHARTSYQNLQPSDLVVRHRSLFAQKVFEFVAEEREDYDSDRKELEEKFRKLRSDAMNKIWAKHGYDGVQRLLSMKVIPIEVGKILAGVIDRRKHLISFVRQCLSDNCSSLESAMDSCVRGVLWNRNDDYLYDLLPDIAEDMKEAEQRARLFRCAPFGQHTWCLLDQYGEEIRNQYWKRVDPQWSQNRLSGSELNELADQLLVVKRPRAALHTIDSNYGWSKIETSRLLRILRAGKKVSTEDPLHYQFEYIHISDAFDSLENRIGVNQDEIAELEFMFMRLLVCSEHGIPNLERLIYKSPEFFVRMVAHLRKRCDNRDDPPEQQIKNTEQQKEPASSARYFLDHIKYIPSPEKGDKIDKNSLLKWIKEARQLSSKQVHADDVDYEIGKLLAKNSNEDDDACPSRAVCEVLEQIASSDMDKGFQIAIFNGTGTQCVTGYKKIKEKYRGLAELYEIDYPRVSNIFGNVADDFSFVSDKFERRSKAEALLNQ